MDVYKCHNLVVPQDRREKMLLFCSLHFEPSIRKLFETAVYEHEADIDSLQRFPVVPFKNDMSFANNALCPLNRVMFPCSSQCDDLLDAQFRFSIRRNLQGFYANGSGLGSQCWCAFETVFPSCLSMLGMNYFVTQEIRMHLGIEPLCVCSFWLCKYTGNGF